MARKGQGDIGIRAAAKKAAPVRNIMARKGQGGIDQEEVGHGEVGRGEMGQEATDKET